MKKKPFQLLKTYYSNTKARVHYTVEVKGVDNTPKQIIFYRHEENSLGDIAKEQILTLAVENKSSLNLVIEMIKSVKDIKEVNLNKLDKEGI